MSGRRKNKIFEDEDEQEDEEDFPPRPDAISQRQVASKRDLYFCSRVDDGARDY